MRSYNPTYGLWNDGEDEVRSRNKKEPKSSARRRKKQTEQAGCTSASPTAPIRNCSRMESSERWMIKTVYVIST